MGLGLCNVSDGVGLRFELRVEDRVMVRVGVALVEEKPQHRSWIKVTFSLQPWGYGVRYHTPTPQIDFSFFLLSQEIRGKDGEHGDRSIQSASNPPSQQGHSVPLEKPTSISRKYLAR